MNPMTRLVIAAAAFLVAHYVSNTPLRARLVRTLGANGYLLLYSCIAFVTLASMVWAYYRAPFIGLWHVPALRHVPLVVMPAAIFLAVCALSTRNPTMVGAERLLRGAEPARGILRVTRHPLLWGIALWAAAHIAARGDAAAIVFFGSFLLLALSGTILIDRRRRANLGADWQRYAGATSNVPFGAIAAGRNYLDAGEIGWMRLAASGLAYALLLWMHPMLFGARPY